MLHRKPPDSKSHALQEYGTLNPKPDAVIDDLFRQSPFFRTLPGKIEDQGFHPFPWTRPLHLCGLRMLGCSVEYHLRMS
jgi:hypothetical protein